MDERWGVDYATPEESMIDFLVKALPIISAILYFIVGVGYGLKKEYAWSLVWISYALANVGLVLAANSGKELLQ